VLAHATGTLTCAPSWLGKSRDFCFPGAWVLHAMQNDVVVNRALGVWGRVHYVRFIHARTHNLQTPARGKHVCKVLPAMWSCPSHVELPQPCGVAPATHRACLLVMQLCRRGLHSWMRVLPLSKQPPAHAATAQCGVLCQCTGL
jgi:hypothetical protein